MGALRLSVAASGYFPEEIVQIGLLSCLVVDNGLRAARKDLKRHLSDSRLDKGER